MQESVARSSTGTPLPRLPHLRLRRRDVCPKTGGRLVIVGDVHGCFAELQRLLGNVSFDPAGDTLVLVGDLANKGPASAEVIRFARESKALCVRGNHDDQVLEAWHGVGRYAESLGSYDNRSLLKELSRADIRWLQEVPLSISFPWLPLVVVHAGLVPEVPVERQLFKDLLWMRELRRAPGGKWEGAQKAVEGSQAWAGVWDGPEHVVFGHDARRKLQQAPFATGLDTGCCYGNHLTALVVDPDDLGARSIVQVPAAQMYSKPEFKG